MVRARLTDARAMRLSFEANSNLNTPMIFSKKLPIESLRLVSDLTLATLKTGAGAT